MTKAKTNNETQNNPDVKTDGAQSEKVWDGNGPTPQQLKDLKARLEGEDAAEPSTVEGKGTKGKTRSPAAPYEEPAALIDSSGKAHSFMDLLNVNRQQTIASLNGELMPKADDAGNVPLPPQNVPVGFTSERNLLTETEQSQPGPGEKPEQPMGSKLDMAGKELHARNLPDLSGAGAGWTPNPPLAAAEGAEGQKEAPPPATAPAAGWGTPAT